MEFSGEYRIPAPRQTVWEALNDADVLKHCISGCESLERVSDTELTAKLKAKVGPVSAKFSGTVTLSDVNAPESYVISGQGQGGAAGFVKGSASVSLTEDGPDVTVLRYESQGSVGGKLASVGGRLVKGVATKTADDFFRAFSERVGGAPPEVVDTETGETITEPEPEPVIAPEPPPDTPSEPIAGPIPAASAAAPTNTAAEARPQPTTTATTQPPLGPIEIGPQTADPNPPLPPARVPPLTSPPPVRLALTGKTFAVLAAWVAAIAVLVVTLSLALT
ncbi:carbon monoxide dehydrogenase subunit G [Roseospira marina]|uniref:Carbon monoxide dehydrogenase subunit G n=1 Tax=Roseospira marina TaxID=140057 RepID=A0A5M6I7N7_9PROT|nr:carbon monoxide dehydrogenase subunit G [Roseospira marina]KAA5604152.1 carbon monoxide dehydrogenase subunit G [Roseospira marina]MBB4315751.1 hypothetical protein [Roseospira marina]MBB5088918.1 hypothetical protein [Roseospira marina]